MAFRVQRDVLEDAIRGLRLLCRGFNVTIPLKTDMPKYLDEASDEVRLTGAVNTVLVNDGRLIGYNTDVRGICVPFERRHCNVRGRLALIFGAGGTSRSSILALSRLGCRDYVVLNRSSERSEKLKSDLGMMPRIHIELAPLEGMQISQWMERADIVVNATPMGSEAEPIRLPVVEHMFRQDQVVFDVVYKPLMSEMLTFASRRGALIIPGYEMLLEQGASSFQIWTGHEAPRDVMEKAMMEALTD